MKILRYIPMILLTIAITGCATMNPKPSINTVFFQGEKVVVFKKLNDMANQCWARKETFVQVGIRINSSQALQREIVGRPISSMITATLSNSSLQPHYPFITLEIRNGRQDQTIVTVVEKNFKNFNRLNLSDDVLRWSNGDWNCKSKS